MPSNPARAILLVDDHAVVRAGLRRTLSRCADCVVAAEASTGDAALGLVKAREFDLVMLDLGLPDRSGLDVLQRMRVVRPSMPVLIVSAHSEAAYRSKAIEAGASGYLTKGSTEADVLRATRALLETDHAPRRSPDTMPTCVAAATPRHADLSLQEFKVFLQLATGLTPSQVAERNFVAVTTISKQRAAILEKMRLQTASELTYYAIKHNLIL